MKTLRRKFICKIKSRSGTTLVELVVTMLLMTIIMGMIVGILSPAAKIFLRMQKLQYAQVILDNTAQQLRDMAGEAADYVKIYADSENIAGTAGAESGYALEFITPEGYAALITADGSPQMDVMLNGVRIDTAEKVEKGRLLARHYSYNASSKQYEYTNDGGEQIARAVAKIFTDGYYMGNYLKVEFSYPDPAGAADGSQITYLNAKLTLYNHEDREEEHLVASEEVVLDFRYAVVCKKGVTAIDG